MDAARATQWSRRWLAAAALPPAWSASSATSTRHDAATSNGAGAQRQRLWRPTAGLPRPGRAGETARRVAAADICDMMSTSQMAARVETGPEPAAFGATMLVARTAAALVAAPAHSGRHRRAARRASVLALASEALKDRGCSEVVWLVHLGARHVEGGGGDHGHDLGRDRLAAGAQLAAPALRHAYGATTTARVRAARETAKRIA